MSCSCLVGVTVVCCLCVFLIFLCSVLFFFVPRVWFYNKYIKRGIESPPKSNWLVPRRRLTPEKIHRNPFITFGDILFTRNDYAHRRTEEHTRATAVHNQPRICQEHGWQGADIRKGIYRLRHARIVVYSLPLLLLWRWLRRATFIGVYKHARQYFLVGYSVHMYLVYSVTSMQW